MEVVFAGFVDDSELAVGGGPVVRYLRGENRDAGFYLFLTPLTRGEHTIHWQASSEACGFVQDITYHLTVTSAT